MKPYILILLTATLFLAASCDSYDNLNGSFEETIESGRINTDVSPKRFFRFHLKQFENDIGGIFETFDMSSYDTFSQVPLNMTNAINLYYCARIDYGYIRDNKAFVIFTDKEQRQWMFTTELGNDALSGTLIRTDRFYTFNYSIDPDYLLPEDAAFYQKNETDKKQIVLKHMKTEPENALDCIYYFKTLSLNFLLSDTSFLNACSPSSKKCNNYKLAIVGTKPHRRISDISNSSIFQIQSARLDDCDLISKTTRPILLRENPSIMSGHQSDLFLATAIIYIDDNQNNSWDSSEPIIASLNNQTIVFYNPTPENHIYGESPDNDPFEIPILTKENINPSPGWHIYNDISKTSEQTPSWKFLKNLTPTTDTSLIISPLPSGSCFVAPTDNSQKECPPLFPIIIQ